MTRTAARDFRSTTKATAWEKDRSAGFRNPAYNEKKNRLKTIDGIGESAASAMLAKLTRYNKRQRKAQNIQTGAKERPQSPVYARTCSLPYERISSLYSPSQSEGEAPEADNSRHHAQNGGYCLPTV